jgi:hypothetical protein
MVQAARELLLAVRQGLNPAASDTHLHHQRLCHAGGAAGGAEREDDQDEEQQDQRRPAKAARTTGSEKA